MKNKSFHQIELETWSERARDYDDLFASVSTQAIDDILNSLGNLKGKHHLDVACGTGHLVSAASKRGAISEGVDFAQAMIDIARNTYSEACFRVADATELPYDDQSMDAITCAFGLSHMENPEADVAEAFRVLDGGGHFVFTLWFGPDDGNELNKIIKDALTLYATTHFTLPKEWTQLRVAAPNVCEAITRQTGFAPPVFKKLFIVWHTKSIQAVGNLFNKLSVRTKMLMDRQPPEIQQQIQEYILSEVEARRANGVISLAWPALLTVVQKPD